MKAKLLSALFIVLQTALCLAQNTYTIGSGTSSNLYYSYPAAYGNYYLGAKNQFIYLAAELTSAGATAGILSEFGFNVTTINSGSALTNFTISMKNSSTTSFSGWETGLTTVLDPASYTPASGWNLHQLTTPFYWDGISNIIVETCFNNTAPYTSNESTQWSTGLSGNLSQYYRADISTVCSGSYTPYGSTSRPNAQFIIQASPPPIIPATDNIFQKTYGDVFEDNAYSILETSDHGFILTGEDYSDGIVIKTDSTGSIEWEKRYGSNSYNNASVTHINSTNDGGYIFCGKTNSYGAGGTDLYTVKINSIGDTLWTRALGNSQHDYSRGIEQTSDGGYIIGSEELSNAFIVKLDANGDTLWSKKHYLLSCDFNKLTVANDGGYLCAGATYLGGWDFFAFKTDSNGDTLWAKRYGGGSVDKGNDIQPTADGGYIIVGSAMSFGAGGQDVFLIKTDANGNLEWSKAFGGIINDEGKAVIQSSDGGYIIAGTTTSFGSGNSDVYLLKTSSDGTLLWSKTFGGTGADEGMSLTETSDGGIAILGQTQSFGEGDYDLYLIKTNSIGNSTLCTQNNAPTIVTTPATNVNPFSFNPITPGCTVSPANTTASDNSITGEINCPSTQTYFQKMYGGTGDDVAYSIQQASDKGFVIAGKTESYGSGSQDFYLVKTDTGGTVEWTKAYGSSYGDECYYASQTKDGGYILIGYGNNGGNYDMIVVKTNNTGDTLWSKFMGGIIYPEKGYEIKQTMDGGYIIAGETRAYATGSSTYSDFYVVKLDVSGNHSWSKAYGGTNTDKGKSIEETMDNGFIIVGETQSFGSGGKDFYLIRTDESGNELWSKTYGGTGDEVSPKVKQTADGGYIIAGTTNSFGAGSDDIYVIKAAANGDTVWTKTYGTSGGDDGYGIQQTFDGGYIISGYNYMSGFLLQLIKTDPFGDTTWTSSFEDRIGGYDVIQTEDGGYATVGYNTAWIGTGASFDFSIIKTDKNGYAGECYQGGKITSIQSTNTIVSSPTTITSTGYDDESMGALANSANPTTIEMLLEFETNVSDVQCNGGSDGTVTVSTYGGILPLTYNWSNGTSNKNLTNVNVGSYSITITDDNGCSGTQSVTINEPTQLSTNISGTDITCNSGNNGTSTIDASGGTPPYNYYWSMGQITSTASGLYQGTYTVNVTDNNGCPATNIITLTEPTVLSLSLAGVDATCIGGNNGSVDLSVSDGTPPYNYNWSNGATTQDITGATQGLYSVTVTDNCSDIIIDSIEITEPVALSNTINSSNITCNGYGDGTASVSPIGGTLPYTYAWSNGAVTQSTSSLSSGSFTVTVTDACGISSNESVTILEPAVLTTSVTHTNASCFGVGDGTAIVIPTGGTSPYYYTWNNGQTSSMAIGLFAGIQGVNVVDVNGCLSSNNVNISQPNPLITNVSASPTTCNGGTDGAADLTVFGGRLPFTYSWSTGASTQDLTSLSAGMYYVTITDSCGGTINDSVSVSEPTALNISLMNTDVTCNGNSDGSINLIKTGGVPPFTYAWSNGASTKNISGLNPGPYNVTVTDACGSVTGSSFVNQPMVMTANISQTNVSCNGLGDGIASVTMNGGTPPFNFLWSTGQTMPTALGLFPGTYTVNVVDSNGCLASDIVTITEPTSLSTSLLSTTDITCVGAASGIATIITSGGTLPYTYLWDDPSNQTNANAVNLIAGSYTVSITDSCGATVTQTATINEPLSLSSTINYTDVSCYGYIDGTAFVIAEGGSEPYTYSWSPTGYNSSIISGIDTGIHVVTVTDSCGSSISDTVIISQPNTLTTTMSGTDISCYGGGNGTATVNSSGGVAPYNYLWNNGQTGSTAIGLFPGNYTVNVTDLNGCLASDLITVIQPSILTMGLSSTDVSCQIGNNGTATAIVAGGTLPYSYLWTPGGYTTPTASNLTEGIYSLSITDSCGTTLIDSIEVDGPSSMSISLATTQISCNGFNDGAIDLIVTNGTPPLTYSWSNGNTSEDVSSLTPGMISVSVTDSCGTTLSDSIMLIEPLLLTTNMTSVNASCNGMGDGMASISVNGGTSPYNYTWNNGQFSSTAIGLFPGTYSVNIVDVNGCLITDLINITEPDALVITNSVIDATCNNSDGSILSSVTGGIQPYVYGWSNGGTSSSNSSLAGGSYSITITDDNGCQDSTTITVPVTAIIQDICIVTVDSSSSMNEVVWEKPVLTNIDSFKIYREISGNYSLVGTQPYATESYFVDSTNGINPQVTSYRYKVSTLDACGNESELSNFHETMHLQINYTGGVANLTWDSYEGFNTTFNYRILRDSTGIGAYEAIDSVTNNNFTYTDIAPPNNSKYQVEVVHPFGGCTADKMDKDYNSAKSNTSTAIGPGSLFSATTTSTNANAGLCDGTGTVTANGGTAPYTYQWDGNANNQITQTATGLCPGTYSVTVYDYKGNDVLVFAIVSTIQGVLEAYDNNEVLNVYPNPFKSKTTISYTLNIEADILLEVYNLLGEKIEILANEKQTEGEHSFEFNSKEKGYSNGIYLIKLTANEEQLLKRIVELK